MRLQADGRLPAPVPPELLKRQLDQIAGEPRADFTVRKTAIPLTPPKMWVSVNSSDELVGQNPANVHVATINVGANLCHMPVTVKVDSARNIWTACEVYGSTSDSAVQEYTSGQALAATYYTTGCPANYSTCSSFTTGSFDESASAADVFSAVNFTLNDAASGCTPCTGGGFLYWPAASPSTTPTLILLPYDNPVEIVYYVDLDSAGNIWFDYYGGCSNVCGYGLGEITNPTTIPSFVSQLAPGSIAYPGGVYISANGKISYTDQMARTITRCTLPGLTGCTPLGPTVLHLGHGSPVSGGYNHAETLNIQGDSFGWLDRGQVNPNIWHYVHNNDMTAGAYGADYTPSDR